MSVNKCCDEYKASLRFFEEIFDIILPLRVHWTVARYSFDKNKPILLSKIYDHIWHLPMEVNCDPEGSQKRLVEVCPFFIRVTYIYECSAWREQFTKICNDPLNKDVLASG